MKKVALIMLLFLLFSCNDYDKELDLKIDSFITEKKLNLKIVRSIEDGKGISLDFSFIDLKFSNEFFQRAIVEDFIFYSYDILKDKRLEVRYYLEKDKGKRISTINFDKEQIGKLNSFFMKNNLYQKILNQSYVYFTELTPYDFEFYSEKINKNISDLYLNVDIFDFLKSFSVDKSQVDKEKITLSKSDFTAYLLIKGISSDINSSTDLHNFVEIIWDMKYNLTFTEMIKGKRIFKPVGGNGSD